MEKVRFTYNHCLSALTFTIFCGIYLETKAATLPPKSEPMQIANHEPKRVSEEEISSSPYNESTNNEIGSGSLSSNEEDSFSLWEYEEQLKRHMSSFNENEQNQDDRDQGGKIYLTIKDIWEVERVLKDVRVQTEESRELKELVTEIKTKIYHCLDKLNENAKLRLLYCLIASSYEKFIGSDPAMGTLFKKLASKKYYKNHPPIWQKESMKCLMLIKDEIKKDILKLLLDLMVPKTNVFYYWVSRIGCPENNQDFVSFSMRLKMPTPYT
jgi:hypothetical protein